MMHLVVVHRSCLMSVSRAAGCLCVDILSGLVECISAGLFLSHRSLGPRDVRMVVLDISLPTGFTPENSDLEMVISLYN